MIIQTGKLSYAQVVKLKKELEKAGFSAGESGRGGTLSVGNEEGRDQEVERICRKYGENLIDFDRGPIPVDVSSLI